MLFAPASINYAYPWWLTYGHLPVLAAAAAILYLGYLRKWGIWLMLFPMAVALWSGTAFLVDRFAFNINGLATLPTEHFLASGSGRVLDVGAGTGRSSIMVLEARPHTTLVASDLFGESFDQHFGREGTPQQRLLANLQAAGVAQRATIVTADMRHLPFPDADFDGVVSAYAMDHVNGAGSDQAIAEAARVLKPGGEFLLMVVAHEPWSTFAFGPLLLHAGLRGPDWWTTHVRRAGFEVMESGLRPFTFYVLARRP